VNGVIKKFDGVNKILTVWSKVDGVIKTFSVWTNVHFLEIVWSHRVVWSFLMFFSDESWVVGGGREAEEEDQEKERW